MKRVLTLSAIPLATLAVAACGSSSPKTHSTTKVAGPPPTANKTTTTTAAPPTTSANLDIAADPTGQLKFTQSKLSTKAGKVTITFTNKAPLPHDMVLINSASYSPSAKVLGQTPVFQGGAKSFTATLAPGTYYYYCSVPGHRQAGMQGTLTVSR
jgi:plastocyanin